LQYTRSRGAELDPDLGVEMGIIRGGVRGQRAEMGREELDSSGFRVLQ